MVLASRKLQSSRETCKQGTGLEGSGKSSETGTFPRGGERGQVLWAEVTAGPYRRSGGVREKFSELKEAESVGQGVQGRGR